MDAKTLEALKASIEKWERNAAVATLAEANIYSSSCPLCDLYLRLADDDCSGCPVSARTREGGCEGSPWEVAYLTRRAGNLDAFKVAAREEVAFLKSLLPVEER